MGNRRYFRRLPTPPIQMADDKNIDLADSVANLSARFDRLEGLVARIASDRSTTGQSAASAACENDNAGRRQVVNEQAPVAPGAVFCSYSELQSEFRAIKESVAKIKLPADLVIGDSRAGIGRADLPKFNLIQKSARYQETILKLLAAAEDTETSLSSVTTVALAHLRFLQEEYTNLLVSSQFDEGTSKLFATLQQNPAAFSPNALENLQRAVSIAGARPSRQVSSAVAPRGRGLLPPLGFGRGSGGSGSGGGFGFGRYRRFGPGPQPADWSRARDRPDPAVSRDLAQPRRPGGGRDMQE